MLLDYVIFILLHYPLEDCFLIRNGKVVDPDRREGWEKLGEIEGEKSLIRYRT